MKMTPSRNNEEFLQERLQTSKMHFRRACEELVHLNIRLHALTNRYQRAKAHNHRSFRYSLRLRLAVAEGTRNMYYDFAKAKVIDIGEVTEMLQNMERHDSEEEYDEFYSHSDGADDSGFMEA